MRPLVPFLCLALSLNASGSTPFPSLGAIQDTLKNEHGLILVCSGSDEPGLQKRLEELVIEPELLPYRLRFQCEGLQGALLGELRSLRDWPEGKDVWALLDADGKVKGAGKGVPAARDLVQALASSGCISRLEALRAFAKENPARRDATELLLLELKRIGEIRTPQIQGRSQPVSPWVSVTPTAAGLSVTVKDAAKVAEPPLRPLREEEDQVVWREYADLLLQSLPEMLPAVQRGGMGFDAFTPDYVRLSSSLQEAARKLLSEVEESLLHAPNNESLWRIWCCLAPAGGGMGVSALLESVEFPPLADPQRWPPAFVVDLCIKDSRSHQDWATLVELAAPVAGMQFKNAESSPRSADGTSMVLMSTVWETLMEPLLEARMALGDSAEATRLMDAWQKAGGWPGGIQRGIALARTYHLTDLLEVWTRQTSRDRNGATQGR